MTSSYLYVGSELDLFSSAKNWKSYWRSLISPFLQGDILEVGCGIGSNARLFSSLKFDHWVCLEPDERLLARAKSDLLCSGRHEYVNGVIESLDDGRSFDAILYLDVLEHIQDDEAELLRASRRLKQNGVLIVLAPAHQWLFSPFDAAVGHYRRYTKASLRKIAPRSLSLDRCIYLDSCGMLASIANRLLLRSPLPSEAQLQTWDRFLVPCSKCVDRALGFAVGKSILCVLRST